MSSSDRRTFLTLAAAGALSSCGFSPAFAPGGPAHGLTGRVLIDEPTTRNAFDFVARIEERLGRPEAPVWNLSYSITTESAALGITSANVITRYNLVGSVRFSLTRLDSGKVVHSGKVTSFTSYSASGTVISTSASERDANQRLMRILADQIISDMIASATDWAAS
jgi:LPS-assembly lipoprotein